MSNMKIMLWYDTEDYVTPESDDALLGLIRMMDKRGVRGTFKIVGEKARVLEQRGRTDILEALKNHEIGYHTDMHSAHPNISEYIEPLGFKEGAEEFLRREQGGLDDLTRITGSESFCYGQPGGSWAPQAYPALRKMNIPMYLDSHDVINLDKQAFWYGGALNFLYFEGTMRMSLSPDGVQKAAVHYDRLQKWFEKQPVGFVSIFYHPCEFSTTEFWDGVNFRYGDNPPRDQWKPSPLRTVDEMNALIDQLGEFIDYTLAQGAEYITASEGYALERSNRGALTPELVQRAAGRAWENITFQVMDDYTLSASEQFSLFMRYLDGRELVPDMIFGPEYEVKSDVRCPITVGELKAAYRNANFDNGLFLQLPPYFMTSAGRINPVDMACALAGVISHEWRGPYSDDDMIEIRDCRLLSKEYITTTTKYGWVIFPKDFYHDNIIRHTQIQAWTLKPAIF